jgi:hypothetical protein
VNDRIIKIKAIVAKEEACQGGTRRLSLGNIIEKVRKAEGMTLGPIKLIRTQNNFHNGSLNKKIIKIQIAHSAQAHEKIEKDILTRLYRESLK